MRTRMNSPVDAFVAIYFVVAMVATTSAVAAILGSLCGWW